MSWYVTPFYCLPPTIKYILTVLLRSFRFLPVGNATWQWTDVPLVLDKFHHDLTSRHHVLSWLIRGDSRTIQVSELLYFAQIDVVFRSFPLCYLMCWWRIPSIIFPLLHGLALGRAFGQGPSDTKSPSSSEVTKAWGRRSIGWAFFWGKSQIFAGW